ncbi:hypothetical protein BKA81DRAFT_350388 [Phyllosticta paracitricarpa]
MRAGSSAQGEGRKTAHDGPHGPRLPRNEPSSRSPAGRDEGTLRRVALAGTSAIQGGYLSSAP